MQLDAFFCWGGFRFELMSCNILSIQAENIALFPEEYVNNKLLTSRRTNTRKHGSLWEFYRYVTDKKGFVNIDEKRGQIFLNKD